VGGTRATVPSADKHFEREKLYERALYGTKIINSERHSEMPSLYGCQKAEV
jgi:hypothetical protein